MNTTERPSQPLGFRHRAQWVDRNIDSVGPEHRRTRDMNPGNLGDLSNLDTATLLQHLPGVRFPAEKEQVAATERNDAPQELVQKIRNADTQRFNSPDEALQAVQEGR